MEKKIREAEIKSGKALGGMGSVLGVVWRVSAALRGYRWVSAPPQSRLECQPPKKNTRHPAIKLERSVQFKMGCQPLVTSPD